MPFSWWKPPFYTERGSSAFASSLALYLREGAWKQRYRYTVGRGTEQDAGGLSPGQRHQHGGSSWSLSSLTTSSTMIFMGHFSSCMRGKNAGILPEVLRCTNIYMFSPLTDTHPSPAAALPRRSFTIDSRISPTTKRTMKALQWGRSLGSSSPGMAGGAARFRRVELIIAVGGHHRSLCIQSHLGRQSR
jgi:hypothetical protein